MVTENTDNVGGIQIGRFWPYIVIVTLLIVTLIAGMAWLIAGQKAEQKELAQIRLASLNVSTAMNTKFASQHKTLVLMEGMLEKQGTSASQAKKDINAKFATQDMKLGAITNIIQQQSSTNAGAVKIIDNQLALQAKNVQQIENALQQQTAVMNRALGKVIPVVMPTEWVKQLTGLEQQVKTPSSWPKNAKEAQEFKNQTAKLIKTLPAWAEDDYLPRLNPIRWAAIAFVTLNRSRKDSALSGIINEMNNITDAAPDGSSVKLRQHLLRDSKFLVNKLDQNLMATTINQAKKYIGNIDLPSADSSIDVANVYEILSQHTAEGSQADEIHKLYNRV